MADPLEQLSDSDLQALAKNDLHSMSDEGLKIVASSGSSAPKAAEPEPFGHKLIREGLPMVGMIGGGMAGEGVASVPLAAAGNAAGAEAAGWLNHKIYGDEAPTYNSLADAKRIATNAGEGALAEVGGKVIGKGIGLAAESPLLKPALEGAGDMISSGFNKAGLVVGDGAAKVAEYATGAPEAAEGMGKDLLDKNMVRPFDTQAQIANRLSKAPAPTEGFDPFTKQPTTIGKDFSGVAQAAKDAAGKPKGWVDSATDMALIAKTAMGSPISAASLVAKKVAAPRALSTIATTANGLSTVLQKTPQFFGKWAPVLTNAAARGELALNASAYVLQQQDPEFRQKMQELNNSPTLTQNEDNNGSNSP